MKGRILSHEAGGLVSWLFWRQRGFCSSWSQPTEAQVLTGYVTQKGILRDEYRLYYGEALKDAELEVKFRNAEALTIRRDYAGAAALLEGVVTQAAVPAVYNNLGVLYAEMK